VAQDWKAAFPELGSDDKHIAPSDLASVALAAIQALNEKLVESLESKDAEIAALRQELRALKTEQATFATRFEKLEKLMAQAGNGRLDETLALTPALSPRERESAGDVAEDSRASVAVVALRTSTRERANTRAAQFRLNAANGSPSPGAADEVSAKDETLPGWGEGERSLTLGHALSSADGR
jgi:hypothetical protein